MNLYMTSGTYVYLKKIEEKHPNETMVTLQNPDHAILIHETTGASIFKQPRSYEVIESSGLFDAAGFAVLNNIPVTDEGKPLFEYHFKTKAGIIKKAIGCAAFRILRPLKTNTYIILTLWKNEKFYRDWLDSKSYEEVYEKHGIGNGANNQPQIFSSPAYITEYYIPDEKTE